eukprot:jgi/Mesen1/8615/ME000050S08022
MELLRANLSRVRVPDASTNVFKEECCISFDTPKSEGGLFVDLNTYIAYGRDYVLWNYEKTGDAVYLKIQQFPKVKSEEPPHKKPTLLGIGVEGGYEEKEVEYEDKYSVVVLPSFEELPFPDVELPEKVRMAVQAVLAAEGAERRSQLAAWVADKKAVSAYASGLQQMDDGVVVAPSGWVCARCDKRDNLWLNLSDGTILCGRKNWDGSGGNNHAVLHYQQTGFPLAVKLGTITSDLAAADVFSYAEDDAVEDPQLAQHLSHFGIDFSALQKTEQTTAERELDQNLSFDWERLQEKGQALQLLHGAGYTGLANLGNSCYMAAVLQTLFAMRPFQHRYFHALPLRDALLAAAGDPTRDLTTQLAKVGHGLLSGKYSSPPPPPAAQQQEEEGAQGVAQGGEGRRQEEGRRGGIAPRMLKAVVAAGHAEFSTARQQDALEFYQHMLDLLERTHSSSGPAGAGGGDPTRALRFRVEERIQCSASGRVSYSSKPDNVLSLGIPLAAASNKEQVAAYEKRKQAREAAAAAGDSTIKEGEGEEEEEVVRPRVPLAACLDTFSGAEEVPGFYSTAIRATTTAIKTARLATFPDYLVLHMRKFVISQGSWVPSKLDVFVDVPDEIDISHMRSTGLQPGEQLLPEDDEERQAGASVRADEAVVIQLADMGFPRARCEKAAVGTGNAGVEEAMNWLLAHMDDPDIDEPAPAPAPPAAAAGGGTGAVSESHVDTLVASLGVAPSDARRALLATGNDVERAGEWIFTHAGESDAMDTEEAEPAASAAAPAAPAPEADLPDGPGKYKLLAFVSHMGANTQCGHYVCHIRKDGRWAIFNDEKVAVSENPPKDMGYLYFFERSS